MENQSPKPYSSFQYWVVFTYTQVSTTVLQPWPGGKLEFLFCQIRATQFGILATDCAREGRRIAGAAQVLWDWLGIFPYSMGHPTTPMSMKGPTTIRAFLLIPWKCAATTEQGLQCCSLRSFHNRQFSLLSVRLTAPGINRNLQMLFGKKSVHHWWTK